MSDTTCVVEIKSPTRGGSVFFSVTGYNTPFQEVLASYCQKISQPTCNYQLLFETGELIPPGETIQKVARIHGNQLTVIASDCVGEWRQKERTLFQMNKLSAALNINRTGEIGIPIAAELLAEIFTYLDLPSLVQCACVSVYWHLLAQQQAMLMQLRLGLFSWHSKLNYPSWLAQMGELSWNLAMSSAERQIHCRNRWEKLNFHKEIGRSSYSNYGERPYQFTKAAGCRLVHSVEEVSDKSEFIRHQSHCHRDKSENPTRVKFLSKIKNHVVVTINGTF
jgi:hypothetical protein